MALFSERYGYVKPSEVLVRESLPSAVANALCTIYDRLKINLPGSYADNASYDALEVYIWCDFLHRRRNDVFTNYSIKDVIVPFLQNPHVEWYRKLDMVELSVKWLHYYVDQRMVHQKILKNLVDSINYYFKSLSYGYRVVNEEIVEITAEEEIVEIEKAIVESKDNVREHLNNALKLLSTKPVGDYRNSIKESISAVEAICRELTGEDTLGKALKKLGDNGIDIPQVLNNAFTQLYAYTNQPTTGIRHSLMDDSGSYVPDRAEATFMLVSCSSFVNYLRSKIC